MNSHFNEYYVNINIHVMMFTYKNKFACETWWQVRQISINYLLFFIIKVTCNISYTMMFSVCILFHISG